MGRQILRAGARIKGIAETAPGTEDVYHERLLKLIPGEVVALYLFLQGVLLSALSGPGQEGQLKVWLWAVFAIILVGNIFYLKKFNKVTDFVQILILSLAFIIWIFTIGGPFRLMDFYQEFMGAVALGIFTFFVPIFYKGPSVS